MRLRWRWLEWVDNYIAWIELGNPFNDQDKNPYVEATIFIAGYGEKALLCKSSWLFGNPPMDIEQKLFEQPMQKNYTVQKALENIFWLSNLDTQHDFDFDHIQQFVAL